MKFTHLKEKKRQIEKRFKKEKKKENLPSVGCKIPRISNSAIQSIDTRFHNFRQVRARRVIIRTDWGNTNPICCVCQVWILSNRVLFVCFCQKNTLLTQHPTHPLTSTVSRIASVSSQYPENSSQDSWSSHSVPKHCSVQYFRSSHSS